jgi:hypothetical protein
MRHAYAGGPLGACLLRSMRHAYAGGPLGACLLRGMRHAYAGGPLGPRLRRRMRHAYAGNPRGPRLRGPAGQRGQASAEFVALLPLALLVLAGAFQFVLAGEALWHARVAARAAARAQAVGTDPRAAARAHLPTRLEHSLRVRSSDDGDVSVSIHVPTVLGALDIGRVSATAHFERQAP